MVFNVLFGISYATTPTSPGVGCNVGAFAVNLTLSFATFFTTCIAINLLLVLAFGFDGNKLEKYYLIGTTILSLALNVPTVALGQFGWNELSATCWYSNADDKVRLRWIIGTQSFWISLSAITEAVCSVYVLFWLYRVQRQLKSWTKASGVDLKNSSSPISGGSMFARDPRYRTIILRIVSLFMNFSTVILDLNMSIAGVNTQMDFRLLVLDLVLYGLRTLAYGVLAAGDPSFINAIREIRKRNRGAIGSPVVTSLFFASAAGDASQSVSSVKDGQNAGMFDVHLQETSSSTTAKEEPMELGHAIAGADIEREMEKLARQL
ncbi:hypothetical protein DXG01_017014 [Tephrocybe rancida]|nr:hypothetical protein DXG01_017014 [Tephrocybe rancida]